MTDQYKFPVTAIKKSSVFCIGQDLASQLAEIYLSYFLGNNAIIWSRFEERRLPREIIQQLFSEGVFENKEEGPETHFGNPKHVSFLLVFGEKTLEVFPHADQIIKYPPLSDQLPAILYMEEVKKSVLLFIRRYLLVFGDNSRSLLVKATKERTRAFYKTTRKEMDKLEKLERKWKDAKGSEQKSRSRYQSYMKGLQGKNKKPKKKKKKLDNPHQPEQNDFPNNELQTIPGIGHGTKQVLNSFNIHTFLDLALIDSSRLKELLYLCGIYVRIETVDWWKENARMAEGGLSHTKTI